MPRRVANKYFVTHFFDVFISGYLLIKYLAALHIKICTVRQTVCLVVLFKRLGNLPRHNLFLLLSGAEPYYDSVR